MCDEDDSTESPSRYQKAEKIILENNNVLQEIDDLRELDVEVRPLPPSPLPSIEDMELVENDIPTEDGQGEITIYMKVETTRINGFRKNGSSLNWKRRKSNKTS